MSKKKMTEAEKEEHIKAVALRKLTDKQLLERFAQAGLDNLEKMAETRKLTSASFKENDVERLVEALSNEVGIGIVTLKKIRRVAARMGFIDNDD